MSCVEGDLASRHQCYLHIIQATNQRGEGRGSEFVQEAKFQSRSEAKVTLSHFLVCVYFGYLVV